MLTREILTYKDAIADGLISEELQRSGQWIIAYVVPNMAWPVRAQKVRYRSIDFWIIPITKDARPAVAVRAGDASDKELREKISRFLSVLSWVAGHGVSIELFGGGSQLIPYSKQDEGGFVICNQLDLRYLPEIAEMKAMLALALMREGRAMRHPAYSFLSFWRVLEVAIGKKKIASWIDDSVDRYRDELPIEPLDKIMARGGSLSKYLYSSGRCAIAHASGEPIVDPDKPEDTRRLFQERPIVEAFAKLAIEEKLGVKTSMTVFREHHYELAGFKRILGSELLEKIAKRVEIQRELHEDIPNIDFGLLGRELLHAFKQLIPVACKIVDGRAQLAFQRSDNRLRVEFELNFAEERLEFDIRNGIYGPKDDGSYEFAEIRADVLEFTKWFFLNGCLAIYDSKTAQEIARKDEFIPVNLIVEPAGFDHKIEEWRTEARRRHDQAVI